MSHTASSTHNHGPANQPDHGALIAVDLGAESCRVSLLRWRDGKPHIELVHRFGHHAEQRESGLHWNFSQIAAGVEQGLAQCAEIATEGVRSIAVDGWAVDYVRLGDDGKAIAEPFCYRDARNQKAEASLHERITPERLRELSGVQLQPLNTVYQQHADHLNAAHTSWLNLPEYLLYLWGGRPVAERSNATHSAMIGLDGKWCKEIFDATGVRIEDAPELVEAGTVVGTYNGSIVKLHGAKLIAPCCHDTASAVAGIPAEGEEWAYISSGTWSLVGTVLDKACNSAEAAKENFTNLGAAGGRVLFHKGINGMWLLQQSMRAWKLSDVAALVEQARALPDVPLSELIDVDDPDLAIPGDMPARINAQRAAGGLSPISDPPQMARLIFESLAARYASVLHSISAMTGKRFARIYIVGGGSQNTLLNALTEKATGLKVIRGAVESSTIGNFALQFATLDGDTSANNIARWAAALQSS
ncbi:MAG: FGGY-family carbohydrate kinase [Edaphobacter sp.]|uniref:rhamnulokinase n=1 Tax=Edaphobacter sp. TaxID=1934404 RepID=UPI0023A5C6A8|nr:FGGY-family carbohydrate kinase [Edaphobacter sp.]MDE1176451.1 FGGY-family carbohydrate kinase [Edaphobacter sp.]